MQREGEGKREMQGKKKRERDGERGKQRQGVSQGSTPGKVTKCILVATCNNLCDILCFALLRLRLRCFGLFAASKLQVASAVATAAATVQ